MNIKTQIDTGKYIAKLERELQELKAKYACCAKEKKALQMRCNTYANRLNKVRLIMAKAVSQTKAI